MDGPRKYAIYLPSDYETSARSYPVLYLLHGSGDDQSGWIQFGEVLRITDQAIRDGVATPMVIVMPNAHDPNRGYFNRISGGWNYEEFFFQELIPHIESQYRVRSEKRFRAVAGLSMGGGGALVYALHRPELFGSCCPLSASVGPLSIDEFKKTARESKSQADSLEGKTDSEIEAYFQHHNALELIERVSAEEMASVRWYIDCGDDDFLYEGNSLVHIALTKKKVPHEYRVRDGAHNWTYWRASLPEVLRFVSEEFHQH